MTSQIAFPASRQPGQPVWLRRLITGLLLAALPLWGMLAGLIQPVSARPVNAPAMTVIINEVAWMGTLYNTNDEWIELYNPGLTTITLTGWVLKAQDGTPSITLAGDIPAGGYFLLEHTTDSVISDIVANQVYTGNNLVNGPPGETLQLFDGAGPTANLIDTANVAALAWPAGNNTTKCSMERLGVLEDYSLAWITNSGVTINGHDGANPPLGGNPICGTPKSANSITYTATPTQVGARRVVINEIAWGGTQADGSLGQWIELYNPGSSPIDITGWHLIAADGVPDIPLSGTIPASGYFLLARSSTVFQSTAPLFPPLAVQQVFSDSLSSTGESLSLFTNTGELVDTANADGGGWPAGTGFVPYRSMERNGANPDSDAIWLTFVGPLVVPPGFIVYDRLNNQINGSPGQVNWANGKTKPTPTGTATVTVTSTRTITPTATVTSTRTQTPTVTLTPLLSSTATQSATMTATATATDIPSMELVINEVAWSGTKDITNGNGAASEWIELHNPGSSTVSLAGWRLEIPGYSAISLTGSILPGGYYLLERGNDSVISNFDDDYV